MNKQDRNMIYRAKELGVCHVYAKGGLGDLISSFWKHCLMSEARFENDDD